MADPKPSDTIITITVSPAQNGKRKILVSGAPEKEMPTVRAGTFPDLHRLIDEVWVELQKRKPQVVKVPSEKKAGSTKPTKDAKTAKEGDDMDAKGLDVTEEVEKLNTDGDTLDAEQSADAKAIGLRELPVEEEQLPLIEGDDNHHRALDTLEEIEAERDALDADQDAYENKLEEQGDE